MAQNKAFINEENITEWLASTGFLFPRTEKELSRYNKLYGDADIILSDSSVSLERILSNKARTLPGINSFVENDKAIVMQQYRMVARKGDQGIPEHILSKMKKNQSNDSTSKKEDNK